MNSRSFARSLLQITSLFVAISAIHTPAGAQKLDLLGGGKNQTVVTTPQVRAELIAHAPQGVKPGETIWAGLKIKHAPKWHTYWKNSGDSGLPTTVDWKLPAGATAGEIAWPTPHKFPLGNLANYGYENTVVLPVPIKVPAGYSGANFTIQLQANWLVCKEECIPEEGAFTLNVPTASSFAPHAVEFEAAFAQAPKPAADAKSQFKVTADALAVTVTGLPTSLQGKPLHFFAELPSVIQTAATPKQSWQGGTWQLEVPLDPQRSASPVEFPFVVAPQVKAYETQALRVVAKIEGAWPAGVAAAAPLNPALDAALKANAAVSTTAPATSMTFWLALISALLGGLILNLMPCVFPVLALKVFGVVKHSEPAARRASAVAYTAGVVLSLLALAGVLLGLRAAGEAVGWGFQLQSPPVVAGLALLFTVLALNFAGVFEFGSVMPTGIAGAQAKNPTVDSFLGGVLAVGVASPCTAPFMGAALGFAVGVPAWQALAIFAALGLGLALPFSLIGFVPALANLLPRPGAWMDTARKLMAFPMLATVVWLVWVLGQQTGIDGAGSLLLILVAVTFVAWSLGHTGGGKKMFAAISVATLIGITAAVGPKAIEMLPLESARTATGNSADWQPWTPGSVEATLAKGQPVFVDFTAAWCVTCQFNKKNALADQSLLADMASKNVARLRADWTRRDPAITQALSQLGRSGVPVYVLYAQGQPPVVFGEVLSVNDVRQAVSKL